MKTQQTVSKGAVAASCEEPIQACIQLDIGHQASLSKLKSSKVTLQVPLSTNKLLQHFLLPPFVDTGLTACIKKLNKGLSSFVCELYQINPLVNCCKVTLLKLWVNFECKIGFHTLDQTTLMGISPRRTTFINNAWLSTMCSQNIFHS